MKICIVGCGAIGGLLAGYLAKTAAEITVVERGEQLLALRERGLLLHEATGNCSRIDTLTVLDSLRDCGTFDVVFLAVKAHEIEPLAAAQRNWRALSPGIPPSSRCRTASPGGTSSVMAEVSRAPCCVRSIRVGA